jgi:hypothetical protein
VYAALGERLLRAVDVAGPGAPAGGCRIQRAVAGTLDEFLDDAEALLAARLGRITLAGLAAQVGAASSVTPIHPRRITTPGAPMQTDPTTPSWSAGAGPASRPPCSSRGHAAACSWSTPAGRATGSRTLARLPRPGRPRAGRDPRDGARAGAGLPDGRAAPRRGDARACARRRLRGRARVGGTVRARRLVLATGSSTSCPTCPGLRERWGVSVLHCPYCHGYEVADRRLGVLAVGEMSVHQALLLPDWSADVTLFTNGAVEPDAAQRAALAARGRARRAAAGRRGARGRRRGTRASGRDRRRAGRRRGGAARRALHRSRTRMASPLAEQLGCAFDDGPFGPVIRTDAARRPPCPASTPPATPRACRTTRPGRPPTA